jgi:arginyl-tRNA synthetase
MRDKIKKYIEDALLRLQKKNKLPVFDLPEIEVDYPKNEKFGDYATNAALIIGKISKKSPLEIADMIAEEIEKMDFKKIEVVAPGYVNFHLNDKYFQEIVGKILKEKEKFGNSQIGKGIKINNEFISANPTGPLHLGNGRGGFYGDMISNVMRKAGYKVVNEYYVNDFGEQIFKLGHSVLKDEQAEYKGEYIDELYEKLKNASLEKAGEKALQFILKEKIKPTVKEKMKINFDSWISEKKDLYRKGMVDKAIKILEKKNLVYEAEGAKWLKTTEFGDDKDRVLVKKDGRKTYFASDCGYILHKIKRGFDELIEIWGADHHGYISRFAATAQALGFQGKLKIIIVQMVRLMKDGEEVRMSKRSGNVVYIDELIDEVGHDVARFFFLMYSPESHMNFDLGLAKEKSEKNPVFYVQYAYARVCSILNKARKEAKISPKNADLSVLNEERELRLIKELAKFPELVENSAGSLEVNKIPQYAISLADVFHSFYGSARVIDKDDLEKSKARLELALSFKIVMKELLNLIGVSAPEKM